jgi:L-2-hydroxyglutarate oxidase
VTTNHDVIIIGGGIVGLAVALRIMEDSPLTKLLLLEKEPRLAAHQSSHNSGVIHSGLYYKPGSLKARNCREGYQELLKFCDQEAVPYKICGKIVVATHTDELARLEGLRLRGIANGLENVRILEPQEIVEFEPYCSGIRGLYVPQTGIVDFGLVAAKYADKVRSLGGEILCDHKVTHIQKKSNKVEVVANDKVFSSSQLVSCAGLYADRMGRLTNQDLNMRIIPFRGEYFRLKPSAQHLVRNLIYPVPGTAFPFLGVHFTRMINGQVECGPNAVLAFSREGYSKTSFNFHDAMETAFWPGFRSIAMKHWRAGLGEFYRSISKSAFVKALQKLVPELQKTDLELGGSGVRAQACSKDGAMIDDFSIFHDGRITHVINAPSPAATSSLAIARSITRMLDN